MEKHGSVLVVEDDPDVTRAARVALGPHVQVLRAIPSLDALCEELAACRFDTVLLDMNSPLERARVGKGYRDWNASDPRIRI
jgi:DNA-binding NtrC family response regulator